MGLLFEVMSTPAVYAMPAYYDSHEPARDHGPVRVDFGPDPLQHCLVWEPAHLTHETVVMWFHGGGYVVGAPESMANAADVYNAMGYRFVSVGFRLIPAHRFPAQVDDAFAGVQAAMEWLRGHGRACERVVVGGSSAGGFSAAILAYGRDLQCSYGLDASALAGYVSCAAVLDADDFFVNPFPTGVVGAYATHAFLDVDRLDPTHTLTMHEALLPYSPIALLDGWEAGDRRPVPYFGIHGTHDTASPYATELAFARRLAHVGGKGSATLCTVDRPEWQHMVTTVTMHKRRVEGDGVLGPLFCWLDGIDAKG
jgi:acetyl esterase/lipase